MRRNERMGEIDRCNHENPFGGSLNHHRKARKTSHGNTGTKTLDNYFQGQLLDSIDMDYLYDDSDEDFDLKSPEESVYKDIFRELKIRCLRYCSNRILKMVSLVIGVALLLLVLGRQFDGNSNDDEDAELDSIFAAPNQHDDRLHKIIVPYLDELYPSLDLKDNSISLFDPRLSPGLLLLYIQNHLILNNGELKSDFTVPFSWEDWVDIDSRLAYDDAYLLEWLSTHSEKFLENLDVLKDLDCKTFSMLYGCEGNEDFLANCIDLDTKQTENRYPYKFKITGPTNAKIKEPGRLLYAGSYLKHQMPVPHRVYLLDVFGEYGEGSLMINIEKDSNRGQKLRSKDSISKFIRTELSSKKQNIEQFNEKGWSIKAIKTRFSKVLSKSNIEKIIPRADHSIIDKYETYVAVRDLKDGNSMKASSWKLGDFIWDEDMFLESLEELASQQDTDGYDYILSKNVEAFDYFRLKHGYHPKYFSEAQLYGTNVGSHYDWRFFSGSYLTDDQNQSIIHRLSRTWLRFCFENGLRTFIAYGSMLGWIRNGLTLPWDGDIDVIVTMESLNLLARNFNQTLIFDYSAQDKFQSAMSGYLIDINPAYYSRVKGDGNNIIDGRLIDISTGAYLDITALAWSDDYLAQVKIQKKLKKLVDKDYEMNEIFALEGEIYGKTLMEELKQLQADRKLIHCKNDNVYTTDELSVMIPSYFEGVRAYFPHAYSDIIWRLYPKALTRITEPDHVFDGKYRLWLNIHDCPELTDPLGSLLSDAKFGTCNSTRVLQEYSLTRKYTSRHLEMLEKGDWLNYELAEQTEQQPLRIDEFFIFYASLLDLTEGELLESYL